MRKFSLLAALLAATACAPQPGAQVTKSGPAAAAAEQGTAPAAFMAGPVDTGPAQRAAYSNGDLVANFLELGFQLESGRQLPIFSRFEGPITVAMTGAVPASAAPELTALINRLRTEAGIDIRPARAGEAAAITIDFANRRDLRRAAPSAACFVVPNATTLDGYKASRGSAAADWATVIQRRQVGIFVPADGTAQEIRDCLHEEMAQALGPLNDLYRLPDSVFNDDNFHAVLTRHDMTILRAWYAPELSPGLSRREVASRLPAIMARINPGAGGGASADASPTPRSWQDAVVGALGAGGRGGKIHAAERALAIANAQGWSDGRMAFSHFALARLLVTSDRARAVTEFTKASAIYRGLPGGAVQVAHIDMQLAAIAVAAGQPDQAIRFADRAIPVIRAAGNQSLLATTMLIKAEALDSAGRSAEAQALRVDSQGPARYGFGSDAQIRSRTREIVALGSRRNQG